MSSTRLLRNQAEKKRLLKERKDTVCGILHPDYAADREAAYVYTPEQCRLKGAAPRRPRPSRGRPPRAQSETETTGTREDVADLLRRDMLAVRELSARYPPPLPRDSVRMRLTQEEMLDRGRLMTELVLAERALLTLRFVNEAFTRMISPPEIRAQPDPSRRVDALLDTWMEGELRKRGRATFAGLARRRIFALMVTHYETSVQALA